MALGYATIDDVTVVKKPGKNKTLSHNFSEDMAKTLSSSIRIFFDLIWDMI